MNKIFPRILSKPLRRSWRRFLCSTARVTIDKIETDSKIQQGFCFYKIKKWAWSKVIGLFHTLLINRILLQIRLHQNLIYDEYTNVSYILILFYNKLYLSGLTLLVLTTMNVSYMCIK
jgi:hypothetical protein